MSNNTRKRIWPVSLVAALGLVVVLAAFVAFGMQPGVSQAQGDPPPNPFATPEPTGEPPPNPFAHPRRRLRATATVTATATATATAEQLRRPCRWT